MYSAVLSSAGRTSRTTFRRGFATRRVYRNKTPIAQSILQNLPTFDDGEEPEGKVPGDHLTGDAKIKFDQFMNSRKPISSAHAIDTQKGEISTKDSAAINASGAIVHGRYGELGTAAEAVPLEYLALLRPAAEGAAAVRTLSAGKKGTMLVFGSTEANGMAAAQLASAAGHAVVAVVGGEHSEVTQMMECVKGLINEPGTAVPDVYALVKKNFLDLVEGIASGNEGIQNTSAEEYVEEFKELLLEYAQAFPEHLPAAVDPDMLEFKGMDKDRQFFKENMEAFLAQYPPGSPPFNKAQLDSGFTKEQYEVFRKKFWDQTSNVISGDELTYFSAPHLVQEQLEEPGKVDSFTSKDAGAYFPYNFSVLNQAFPEGISTPAGGPVLGAVIAVTPPLEKAAKAIAAAKTIRAKGEALQFLTSFERTAFGAAASVAAVARKHGAPVYAMGGSLPGMKSIEAKDEDVKAALAGMDIGEDGTSKLNYFVQVYRACDFPFYGDYAVHRATEPLAGPRQIVVAK